MNKRKLNLQIPTSFKKKIIRSLDSQYVPVDQFHVRDEIDDESERTKFRHNHAKDRNHSSAYDDMIKGIKEEIVKSLKVSEKTTFFEGAISFGVKVYTSKKFRNFIFSEFII